MKGFKKGVEEENLTNAKIEKFLLEMEDLNLINKFFERCNNEQNSIFYGFIYIGIRHEISKKTFNCFCNNFN